eukprot:Gregarina_sp_Poly_1__10624@NODE_797_length_6255_cov_204_266968_g583_i0_p1_GENE_NODE_797_length_6255_cov_204_266968_g583_i0NODE_797_length_6255_cov_204_266968_g583_i0_p1_ORF_typecomplete_len642_score70_02_NODE_797_length_6255_cov_204_266968_g583_i042636188
MMTQSGNRGRYSQDVGTPSVSQSPSNAAWIHDDPAEVVVSSPKSEWKRRLREQPEDLGRWLCWKSKQAGCLTVMCLFIVILLLGSLSYVLVQAFTSPRAAAAPELSKVQALLKAEAARGADYQLSPSSFTPQNHHDFSAQTTCDTVHYILEKGNKTRLDNAQMERYYSQLLLVHSHWAEAFNRHCFLSLAVEDISAAMHTYAPYRAAGYLNALSLEGSLTTTDDNFPWILYTPITTVPSNLFYGMHDLISLLSIGLNKRVSLLDRLCFHDDSDPGCVGNTRHGLLQQVHRPDGVDKIAMVFPLAPQMDGPPVVKHGVFLYQPSRLSGWFMDIVYRAAEVGTATADPLSWAAEHILGINEDVLQKLSLNPANEHIWQSACHGGDVVIAKAPSLQMGKKWSWAKNLTEEWFPEGRLEKEEPSHIVFVCSRILESEPCQKDSPDPMLKFTCGDFGANLIGCEESVSTLSHEFGECHSLIPELMEKEKERFRKHWKEHRSHHPAHGRQGSPQRHPPREHARIDEKHHNLDLDHDYHDHHHHHPHEEGSLEPSDQFSPNYHGHANRHPHGHRYPHSENHADQEDSHYDEHGRHHHHEYSHDKHHHDGHHHNDHHQHREHHAHHNAHHHADEEAHPHHADRHGYMAP